MIQLERRENYGRYPKISIHCIIWQFWNWDDGWISYWIVKIITITVITSTIPDAQKKYHKE